MTNSEIADNLKLYADLSELNGGNPFKIKSYASAAFRIDKYPVILEGKNLSELEKMDGIGKSIAEKIYEINQTGSFPELNKLLLETPEGVQQMLNVNGIGPKKVGFIWKELGIESIGELLYACNENRLSQVKGFGIKTQQNIKNSIEFIFSNANRFHYFKLEPHANELLNLIKKTEGVTQVSFSGKLRRKCEVLEEIELIVSARDPGFTRQQILLLPGISGAAIKDDLVSFKLHEKIPVKVFVSPEADYEKNLFIQTAAEDHLNQSGFSLKVELMNGTPGSESEIYNLLGLSYIEPELREGLGEIEKSRNQVLPVLIESGDLKGILHNHSTWSDGLNTLEEMAVYCKELGYQYLGICDHSRSAQYAGGLKEEQIIAQHTEIDLLNRKLGADDRFRIFKGIESDILFDGRLDYPDEILASFDFIVASVHSNLKMNEEKAMARLISAIENPYTTILGHPTGRLLLMREGYPVDHRKMIDACAANGVVIEINANPYRLDLDWRWIDYALGREVMLSVNPDAHRTEGYHDMYYGICVSRKGGLMKEYCLNAKSLSEIETYFSKRKPR